MDGISRKRSHQNDGPESDLPAAKRAKLESDGVFKQKTIPTMSGCPELTGDNGLESAAPKTGHVEPSIVLQQGDMPALSGDPNSCEALESEPPAAKLNDESGGSLEQSGVPKFHRDAEPNGVVRFEPPVAKVEEPEPGSKLGRPEVAAMDAGQGSGPSESKAENFAPNDDSERSSSPVAESVPWYRYILGGRLLARQRDQLEPDSSPAQGDVLELQNIPQRGVGPGSSAMLEPVKASESGMIPLSKSALKRLEKRPAPRAPPPDGTKPKDIARFARNGGPDLRLIFEEGHDPRPTLPRRGRRDYAFSDEPLDPVLFCSRIYPICYNFPADAVPVGLEADRDMFLGPNESFSSANVTAADFEHFKRENRPPDGRPAVLANVVKILTGDDRPCQPGGFAFANMTPLGRTSVPAPDYFDAAGALELDSWVLRALDKEIAPTADPTMPVAPNFFLEVRAAADGEGAEQVSRTRAYLDGAYGARAMHALQNYGRPQRICDERARTYTATFQAGTGLLEIYCHHVAERTPRQEELEFYTTYLWGLTLTASLEAFIMGVAIFRNVREAVRRKRDELVRAANIRALHVQMASTGAVGQPWRIAYDESHFEQRPPS